MEDSKSGIYEMQLSDLMRAIEERYAEIDPSESSFEDGRKEAYEEIIDMVKTRYKMIYELLEEED